MLPSPGAALGLSTDGVQEHLDWIKDVNDTQHTTVKFPIVADFDSKVTPLYEMIHAHESDVALPGFPSENRWILMYRHARAVVSQNVYVFSHGVAPPRDCALANRPRRVVRFQCICLLPKLSRMEVSVAALATVRTFSRLSAARPLQWTASTTKEERSLCTTAPTTQTTPTQQPTTR
jgi:hypothetical protein